MSPQKTKKSAPSGASDRVTVENVNVPGYTTSVDAAKYHAMRRALLKVLPTKEPGLTQTEMRQAVPPVLPKDLFPDAGKVGWWAKAVQLDLEAKKIIVREQAKPLRWHQRSGK